VSVADVYDCHDYEQDVEKFRANQAGLAKGEPFMNTNRREPNSPISIPYGGQPFFVSEFGGIWWNPEAKASDYSWGYGNRPKDVEEWHRRFEGLTGVLLDNPLMFGYCYTQNGVYRFDRRAKFDLGRLHAAQTRRAAIEAEED
jgi:hypothetical protein